MIAAAWRHTGYIMVLYLAGLKSVDPSLRDAAKVDGASEWQTFRRVIFPVLKPINIVVLVVTVIESLRAFDIVYVINGGKNGLELLSVLVYDNIVGEASRIGYGSAIGTILLVIALGFIITYLVQNFRSGAVAVSAVATRQWTRRAARRRCAGAALALYDLPDASRSVPARSCTRSTRRCGRTRRRPSTATRRSAAR